jgi:hypothetical protein
MNTEEERELFDKWYGKKPRGWFEAVRYNTAWRAWLASTNREGYKLVPLEPSQEMLIAADNCEIDGKVTAHNIYKAMIGACDE